jgi:hypothetical protein
MGFVFLDVRFSMRIGWQQIERLGKDCWHKPLCFWFSVQDFYKVGSFTHSVSFL